MTPVEKKLARYLLMWAAVAFSEAGENDLDLIEDAGLTPEEALEVKTALYGWLKSEAPPQHVVQDWQAMGYMASRLGETDK